MDREFLQEIVKISNEVEKDRKQEIDKITNEFLDDLEPKIRKTANEGKRELEIEFSEDLYEIIIIKLKQIGFNLIAPHLNPTKARYKRLRLVW